VKIEVKNPFTVVKAGDYTDQQILDYWVDIPDENGFEGIVNPLSTMPMILVGGKGSGKTHLMRYFSYPLQKIRYKDDIIGGINKAGFIGLYLRCGGLNSERFSGKNIDPEIWDQVFSYSFEIWLSQIFLETLIDLTKLDENIFQNEKELCDQFLDCFDEVPQGEFNTVESLLVGLKTLQKKIDIEVNNCLITQKLDIKILASPGKLFFGFPEVIKKGTTPLKDLLFVYLIDELENLLEPQQKFIQTLIRDRRTPCCIKIGVRTYGIKTFKTLADGEANKPDSEFEFVRLDHQLRNRTKEKYSQFAVELCIKRLIGSGLIPSNVTITKELFYDFFESVPQIDELKNLDEIKSGENGKTIKKLKAQNFPLLERACVYEFYKRWSRSKKLLTSAIDINNICISYEADRDNEPKFKELISKFKTDLNAQLKKDNAQKQVYAGVDTLIELSKGFPRSLLTLLKHIYKHSVFNDEMPFIKGKISITSQVEGVKLASSWFLEDAQTTGKDGGQLKIAIEGLSELFKINRYSDKPSECSLRAFDSNLSDTTETTQRLITLASNWSLLLRDESGRRDKNSNRVNNKYILNPMLAPNWGLPIAERGTLNLNKNILNSLFDPEYKGDFNDIRNNFEKARNVPFGIFDIDIKQQKLKL